MLEITGDTVRKYIRGLTLAACVTGNAPVYYQYDGHGSVVQLTDATGAVIKNYDYDAFGNHIVQSYDDANPFRYSGEYFDDETDLYYLRARYYWPSLGQFTQEDTYRGEPNNPLSLNLYTYCYNDPVQYVDRSGNSPETVLDVASLTYSAKAYREDPSFGNAISYYWDLGAVFIPIFPGTYIFKLGKWLKWGSSAVDTVKAIDNTADGAKIIENGVVATRKIDEKRVEHIFRNDVGHFLEDTPQNRALLENVANGKNNFLGTDKYGNEWYSEILDDGSQLWVQVRDGKITNGGVNQSPRVYNPETGLSKPNKPT